MIITHSHIGSGKPISLFLKNSVGTTQVQATVLMNPTQMECDDVFSIQQYF